LEAFLEISSESRQILEPYARIDDDNYVDYVAQALANVSADNIKQFVCVVFRVRIL
jgi:hypothetical protein